MQHLYTRLFYFLLASIAVSGKTKTVQRKKTVASSAKGIQCYNCLSLDHPGCWEPDHPDNANITVPSVDCVAAGEPFLCVVITAESAELAEGGRRVGAVRARSCVSARRFPARAPSFPACAALAAELRVADVFTRVAVARPHCALCDTHLCTEPSRI